MCIRTAVGASALSLRSQAFAAALLLSPAAALLGQEPGASAAEPASSAAPVYGRVIADEAPLRCWSGTVAAPPVYEDVLKKGQIVRLGRTENGFRAVEMPLGPVGYVSQRFAVEDESGVVRSKGNKVAFRYRPRTSEAPVAQLAAGTVLHVVSTEESWFRARVAGVEAWVANAEVQVVASDPEVVAAYEQFKLGLEKEVQARLDLIAAEQEIKARSRVDLEAVEVVESAFRKEMQKPIGQQKHVPLMAALSKAVAEMDEDSSARAVAASLHKRIKTQKWIVDASDLLKSEPPVADEGIKIQSAPKDGLKRFESIGWLRYSSRLSSPGIYYLEKGGRQQHVLTCNTGRFDLSMFVGREIGVIGPRRTPLGDQVGSLDVERLEVLGNGRR
ncbi:MAG: SH3 domain-containing protein [Planctomycetota bacterium]